MRISDWSSDVCSSDLAEHQRAELEAGVDVGEEDFLVLEVEQGTEPPRGGIAAEERRRPLVGGDPRRRQQAYDAIGPRQVRGAFDELAVDVDVAGRQPRVVAASWEGHRVGTECVRTGRVRWWQTPKTKTKNKQ